MDVDGSQTEVEQPSPTLEPGILPRHIAIIMDGNGRWAEERGMARWEGHAFGAKTVREIVTTSREIGIQALTLYAFSVQNWSRPDLEIEHLMTLLLDYLVEERKTLIENDIRLQGIGQIERLPEPIQKQLRLLEEVSKSCSTMTLTLALSYGGREEIVDACRQVASEVSSGTITLEQVDEAALDKRMFTRNLPELDLLIRTSGEMRISNFLLWQAAYAEFVVTDVLWPEFTRADFYRCIEAYRSRQRRFGKTGTQIETET